MTKRGIAMQHIREILRLHYELRLSHRGIARARQCQGQTEHRQKSPDHFPKMAQVISSKTPGSSPKKGPSHCRYTFPCRYRGTPRHENGGFVP